MRNQQLIADSFAISASRDYEHPLILVFLVVFLHDGIDTVQQSAVNVITTRAVFGATICGQNIDVGLSLVLRPRRGLAQE